MHNPILLVKEIKVQALKFIEKDLLDKKLLTAILKALCLLEEYSHGFNIRDKGEKFLEEYKDIIDQFHAYGIFFEWILLASILNSDEYIDKLRESLSKISTDSDFLFWVLISMLISFHKSRRNKKINSMLSDLLKSVLKNRSSTMLNEVLDLLVTLLDKGSISVEALKNAFEKSNSYIESYYKLVTVIWYIYLSIMNYIEDGFLEYYKAISDVALNSLITLIERPNIDSAIRVLFSLTALEVCLGPVVVLPTASLFALEETLTEATINEHLKKIIESAYEILLRGGILDMLDLCERNYMVIIKDSILWEKLSQAVKKGHAIEYGTKDKKISIIEGEGLESFTAILLTLCGFRVIPLNIFCNFKGETLRSIRGGSLDMIAIDDENGDVYLVECAGGGTNMDVRVDINKMLRVKSRFAKSIPDAKILLIMSRLEKMPRHGRRDVAILNFEDLKEIFDLIDKGYIRDAKMKIISKFRDPRI